MYHFALPKLSNSYSCKGIPSLRNFVTCRDTSFKPNSVLLCIQRELNFKNNRDYE